MPSQYLQRSELHLYGLDDTVTDAQIIQASALIDAYLQRPEGLVWSPDYLGMPCYMAGPSPELTFTSSGAIAPGNKVSIPLTQQVPAFTDMIGEVVILDRGNSNLTEACVIAAMTPGNIELSSVVNTHSAGCTMETGLVIFEEKALPQRRSITRTSRPPVRLLSGMGRYGYGRRTDQEMGMYNEVNLLAEIQAFGGPPMWVPFDIGQCSVSYTTREVWLPAGILLAYFSEARLRYVSGWSQKALPAVIKQATAQIVTNFQSNPEIPAMLKSVGAGSSKMERFAPTQLDNDTRTMLEAYRVKVVI